ncbi:MAG TPA: hypothetical protein VGU26_05380 [Gaiellaceae bacterium]|nr:hypothetical protein [Gaiellaceae bacterium]
MRRSIDHEMLDRVRQSNVFATTGIKPRMKSASVSLAEKEVAGPSPAAAR